MKTWQSDYSLNDEEVRYASWKRVKLAQKLVVEITWWWYKCIQKKQASTYIYMTYEKYRVTLSVKLKYIFRLKTRKITQQGLSDDFHK